MNNTQKLATALCVAAALLVAACEEKEENNDGASAIEGIIKRGDNMNDTTEGRFKNAFDNMP